MVRDKVDEGEAAAKIARTRPSWQRVEKRNKDFLENMANLKESAPMLSNKQRKNISYDIIGKVFNHLAHALHRRLQLVRERSVLVGRRRQILDELTTTKDSLRVVELIKELDTMEDDIHQTQKPVCFATKATSDMEARRYFCATTYMDSWIEVKQKGVCVASFMTWFVCGAKVGSAGFCGVITASKRWLLHKPEDPLASGQRWYCPSCRARYRPKFGLLVELFEFTSGTRSYALAELDGDMMDVKGIDLEKKYGDTVNSPEEPYAALPDIMPVNVDVFRPLRDEEYDYGAEKGYSFKVLDYDRMLTLPKWSWNQLWRFAAAP
jgi:hypothetical protein